MSGWGSKSVWPNLEAVEEILKHDIGITPELSGVMINQQRLVYTAKAATFETAGQEKEYNNKVPTHDPYTNPNTHIYYECKCGAILDPSTKSFAALNNYASEKGWKVRWRQDGAGYEPFCVECGKDVE